MLINVYILYFMKTENAKVWLYNSSHVTSSKVHTYHKSNLFWFITLLKLFTKKRNFDFLRRRNRSKSYMYIVYMTDIWVSLWGRELCIGQGEGYNLCEAFLHVTLYGRHNRKGWWWWWCPPLLHHVFVAPSTYLYIALLCHSLVIKEATLNEKYVM